MVNNKACSQALDRKPGNMTTSVKSDGLTTPFSPQSGRRPSDHARTAMHLMKEHKIEPYPDHFRIWYTYSSGANKGLNRTIDILLSNRREISHTVCENLYSEFFVGQEESAQMAGITLKIKGKLQDMVAGLKKAGLDTSQFNTVLEGAGQALQDTPETQPELISIIDLLMQATRQMKEHNEKLDKQLHSSIEQVSDLHNKIEEIRTVSITDMLTGVGNRRYFDEHLVEFARDSMETGEPLSLLFLDIDKFKIFNDTWGHALGDQVLRLFAGVMLRAVGNKGACSRYGGEEFAVLLPKQEIGSATKIAEEIRRAIASREVVNRSNGQKVGLITVSVGVAQYELGESLTKLVERADACLYAAKQGGRNRVFSENEMPQPACKH